MKKDNRDNLDKLEKRLNSSLDVFHISKDSINGDRYLGLVDAVEMVLEMIKELKEESK